MSDLQYATVSELLQPLQLPVSTSEVHGLLIGYLAAGGSDVQQWLDDADVRAADGTAVPTDVVETLYRASAASLRATDFSFRLLLPADSAPLASRVVALVDWSRGFLAGFGLAGPATRQHEDGQEFLRDLAQIATAAAPDSNDEQDENALAELQEYVRMGAMLLDAHSQDDVGMAAGGDDD